MFLAAAGTLFAVHEVTGNAGLLLAAVAAVVWLGCGVLFFRHASKVTSTWTQTTGAIRGSERVSPRRGRYPVFEYALPDGRMKHATDSVGGPLVHLLAPRGTKITVVYDPENPADARIYSLARIWGSPVVMLSGGGVALLVPIVGLVKLTV